MRRFAIGIVLLSLLSILSWGQESNEFRSRRDQCLGSGISPGRQAREECRFV